MNEYAVYQGDSFQFIGTVKEIAERLNIKESTVRWTASKSGELRFEMRKNKDKALRIINLGVLKE